MITNKNIYKIRDGVFLRKPSPQSSNINLVDMYTDDSYFEANHWAARTVFLIDGKRSIFDITQEISRQSEQNYELIYVHVSGLIQQLVEENLIELTER